MLGGDGFGRRSRRSAGRACGQTHAARARSRCLPLFGPRAVCLPQARFCGPESLVPRLFRGARLRPQELEAWPLRRSEASHGHTASSAGRHFPSAGSLPKAPCLHCGPLVGARGSSGASVGRPGQGRRASGPLPQAMRAPATLPGLLRATCWRRIGLCLGAGRLAGFLVQLGRLTPLRSRRGLACGGFLKRLILFLFVGREVRGGPSA